jgi:aryl-alcohol dehydrogenase-like predicted oxidoreductase
VLTGKYTKDSVVSDPQRWLSRADFSRDPELDQLALIRDLLVSDGRTLAQAALGWIWARSERAAPIPGCRNVAQVEENAAAMEFGPLSAEQMQEIDELLER